jgi:dienelactone hydrolase
MLRRRTLVGCLAAAAAVAQTTDLPLLTPDRRVPAWLTRPEDRPGPFPAVVLLTDPFGIDERVLAHQERLLHEGLAVLIPHVWIARGMDGEADVAETDDPAELLPDLAAALRALAGTPGIAADRLGVLGLGLAGGTAMLAWWRGMPGLAAAAALYPPCDMLPQGAAGSPSPLLVLVGARDSWSDAGACRRALAGAQGRARIHVYPGAGHALDRPVEGLPFWRVFRRADGRSQLVGPDPVVAEDARGRAAWFLAEALRAPSP